MKNFVFAKVGKSIKFQKDNYSPIGGDNEASCVLRALANNNPDKNFYLIGRSDFSRLSKNERIELFPYENVIDVWKNVSIPSPKDLTNEYYHHVLRYFQENFITIDYGIFMVGQIGTVTIPNRTLQIKKQNLTASVIDMTKYYSTPIIEWINRTDVPYIEIINDPRYKLNCARDITRPPTVSIGQYDFVYNKRYFTNFEDQTLITTQVKSTYSGVEKAFCIDYDSPPKIDAQKRSSRIINVVLNEGNPSRYEQLNEWLLKEKRIFDVRVYGKWSDDVLQNDSRFLGSAHISEIQRIMQSTRCTFIIPIAPGWVTSKYIEMIQAGVIPFFHPTYDEQNHTKMPEFYRPSTPRELHERMNLILHNDDEYERRIHELISTYLTDDVYSGAFVNNAIMKAINSQYIAPDLKQYSKTVPCTLEHFFS